MPSSTQSSRIDNGNDDQEDLKQLSSECKELLLSLPKVKGWRTPYLYKFQDFWCQPNEIQAIIAFQKHFKFAKDNDIVLASIPKSGTTWLKALSFAIINRKKFPIRPTTHHNHNHNYNHPLLTSNPHDLVPFLEYKLYADNQIPDLSKVPRVFATHVPFGSLSLVPSMNNNVKIVYICRNPFDTFISSWHFVSKLRHDDDSLLDHQFPIEKAFKMYCDGVVGFGPFWDHMLGYWNESLKEPNNNNNNNNVLFLKYEDLRQDIGSNLVKLASFLGFPFSIEEIEQGVVEEIAKLCSFEEMKELDVNKKGKSIKNFENKHLFRKGEVGDWMNYFSPLMVQQLSSIMDEKLHGSGLSFKLDL